MIQVEWQVEPAITALRGLLARLHDLRPAWQSVVIYLRRAMLDQFASEGSRGGSQWQPLSEAYAKWKAVNYPGQPILRASDRMFESLTSQTGDSIVDPQPQELTFGTRTPYARYHQAGTDRMPQRKILQVTDADRREVKRLVRAHLANQAALGGFGAV